MMRIAEHERMLAPLVVLAAGLGCGRPPAESPTRGRLAMAVAESHAPLVKREAELFDSLYNDARVSVRSTTTREAFIALLADSVRSIVVDRPPNDEERRAMQELHLQVAEVPIGEDALGLMVNRANSLPSVSLEQAADLLSGRTRDWGQLAGSGLSGPVTIVMTDRNSGAWELLAARFFPGARLPVPNQVVPAQRDVLENVVSNPRALGVVSVAAWKDPGSRPGESGAAANAAGWANGVAEPGVDAAVRALAIAGTDAQGNPALHALHKANIHLGVYPLHYSVYIVFDTRSLLAAGFSAFVASAPGQKLILDAGLVPATMPVRLVQLD